MSLISRFSPLGRLGNGVILNNDGLQVHLITKNNNRFEDILSLRKRFSSGQTFEEPCDEYSSHYIVYWQAKAAVTIRVTLAENGPFDCHEAYPKNLVKTTSDTLVSSSRLCGDKNLPNYSLLVKQLMLTAWLHQFHNGTRADIINSKIALKNFYLRLGFKLLEGFSFTHPRTQQQHEIFINIANPTNRSFLQEAFKAITTEEALFLENTFRL